MSLPFGPPLEPMLARGAEEMPTSEGLVYEPKWDGFRALVFHEPERTEILSRNGLPLARYFPELAPALAEALPPRCVLDGEVVIAGAKGLDFDALQLRMHPAESRIRKLAAATPAWFIAFDLLALGSADLRTRPLRERRRLLVESVAAHPQVALTPQTADLETARGWFDRFEGAGLDGVMAKPAAGHYRPGERLWVKVKHHRSADCVVAGYRLASDGRGVGSLLLGLYDSAGRLHHVGHTSSFRAAERRDLLEELRPLEGGAGFGPQASLGQPSRWRKAADTAYVALQPDRVCEVHFDQLQSGRFRHATRLLRWRPDKTPAECTYEQLATPHPFALADIVSVGRAPS
ncbi:MAG: ATP-dependent DNA ligase [Candidatus Dormibacteria bacterium]